MMGRILVFSLALAFACTKKTSSSEEESTPEMATADQGTESKAVTAPVASPEAPDTAPDFLVGKWASDCVNQPSSLQASFIIQYEFSADGNASSKNISYAAADCNKRFTKADVDGLTAQINADRALQLPPAAPMNAAELGAYEALWFPPIKAFNFKLGRTLKDETVEMNYTQKLGDQMINTYVTIFVEDNNLYFAEVCRKDDLDNGSCSKIVGDSVKNRARDMSNAIAFRKL